MWNVYPKTFGELIEQRIRNTEAGIRKAQEELYVNKDPIKVGDKVYVPKHGVGKVLAIVGDNAWVQTPVRDYPLTFDIKKLKPITVPRQGVLCTVQETKGYFSDNRYRVGTIEWGVPVIELTNEVRERLKDIL